MRRLDATAAPWVPAPGQALPPGAELSRQEPARPASWAADLGVPLGQAVATGALLGGLVGFVAGRAGYRDWPALWLGVGLVVACCAWLLLLGQTRRLLWAAERLTGRDLDGDRRLGKPAERVIVVNAGQAPDPERADQDGRRSRFAAFVAALPIRGTSARTWEGELGRAEYQAFRDVLLRAKLARWCSLDPAGRPNERRGWELTVDPAEVLRRISG